MKIIKKNNVKYFAILYVQSGQYIYSYGIVYRGRLDIIGAFIDYDAGLRSAPIYLDQSVTGQYLTDVIQWMEQKGYTRVED